MLETTEMKSKRMSKIIELKSLQLERLNNETPIHMNSDSTSSSLHSEMKSITPMDSGKSDDTLLHDSE